jgi:hypothetical protein
MKGTEQKRTLLFVYLTMVSHFIGTIAPDIYFLFYLGPPCPALLASLCTEKRKGRRGSGGIVHGGWGGVGGGGGWSRN